MNRATTLLAAALLAAPAAAAPVVWSRAPTYAITIEGGHYTPNRLVLRRGHPYRLRVVNRDGGKHDVTAEAFFAGALVDRAAAPDGTLRLRGGETRTIRLIPDTAGIFRFHSKRLGDAPLGLSGEFVVR